MTRFDEVGVLEAVGLEVLVVLLAVQHRPVGVDFVAGHDRVDLWLWQVVARAEGAERILEGRARRSRRLASSESRWEVVSAQELGDARFVYGSGEGGGGEGAGEVGQCAGRAVVGMPQ